MSSSRTEDSETPSPPSIPLPQDQPPPPPSKDDLSPPTEDSASILAPSASSGSEPTPSEIEKDDAPLEKVSLGAVDESISISSTSTELIKDEAGREGRGGAGEVAQMAVPPFATTNEVILDERLDGPNETTEPSAKQAPPPPTKESVIATPRPRPPILPPSSPSSATAPSHSTTSLHRPQSSAASSVAYPAGGGAPSSSQRSSLSILPSTTLSSIHLLTALTTMSQSKDARRSQPLQKALATALEALKAPESHDVPIQQEIILEPLRLACETKSALLQTTALDCISKLVSHSFFHTSSTNAPELADTLTQIITATYTETTPDAVALQIVKSLLALVLSATIPVHHSSLLKAVRTVYNIFLLSTDPINQMVAQGGLTQMVHHVFGRVDVGAAVAAAAGMGPSPSTTNGATTPAGGDAMSPKMGETPLAGLGLASLGASTSLEVANGGNGIERSTTPLVLEDTSAEIPPPSVTSPTTPTTSVPSTPNPGTPPKITLSTFSLPIANDGQPVEEDHDNMSSVGGVPLTEQEMFVKDAFLVFRALCKLTMKPLMSEAERDIKSHAMRSKLLSLHLILTILQSHVALFASPQILIPSSSSSRATFVQATKQYLCLSLSRNAVSPVGQVFELSVEIFWNVLKGLRGKMKKEIEVLLNEIFLPILEMRTSTIKQKATVLTIFLRLSQDPQALVEIYLNYDCDRTAVENIYERLVEIVAKIGATHFAPVKGGGGDQDGTVGAGGISGGRTAAQEKGGPVIPPSLTTSAMGHSRDESFSLSNREAWAHLPAEVKLRRQSLECLVTVLRSLVTWGTAAPRATTAAAASAGGEGGEGAGRLSEETARDHEGLGLEARGTGGAVTPVLGDEEMDDPERFESAKQRKTTLMEGIKKFNFKPKKGIQFLVEQGFIRSKDPADIARFLLQGDGLSKAMIGEFLGEGDEANVAIMHSFVDMLDFRNMKFTEAVRTYLQSFRLPGEAQKIDRFVLKFAERYIAGNPRTEFANADTAYILAFSVIMLNTDAHNKNIGTGRNKRMTKAEFVKNNRGINDGKDLPEEFLGEIYDEIQGNEIKMKDEVEAPQLAVAPGLANTIANVGRDLQKEAYVLQSEGMTNRSEALFKTMLRQQRRGGVRQTEQYYSASHLEHVRPMFEVAWMPFLAALSGPLQETDDQDVVELCLEGFKHAIKIVCLFDLELERNAFVTTLAKFTFLNNLSEMRPKNVAAIKMLLDIAVSEGNYLKSSWKDVLTCVSQLERMQLISNGIETPDIGRRSSVVSRKSTNSTKSRPGEDVAFESRSAQVTVAADMVFSLSKHLSGSAIVEFVQALSDVSWEEIQSSSGSDRPRLFSLQKLVEISYYNMGRIRLEWSNIWQILGEHFNQVCCHNNANVSFFALDALRQLAMRFLEKDELSHFQFQKDFLKPFEYTMIHNTNTDARDMVLQCLQQMIQARVGNMRSGWRTMFGVFSAAAKVLTERVATYAFELVTLINREHFAAVVRYGAFADLTVCMTDFCKVNKFQKISLQAIEMLQGVVPAMLACPDCALSTPNHSLQLVNGEAPPTDDPMVKFWFPVLFSHYDVIMNGDDLEVRRVALDSLFDTLKKHGSSFRTDFWDSVCQQVLFPIFAPLRSGPMQEEMSFWVSTTMVSALRNLIDLYTFYFEILERFLDPLLDLLCFCIDQENDTLARIGTTCFQQLLENNVRKLSPAKWERIVSAFVQLFQTTLAHMLFDENLRSENELPESPAYLSDLAPTIGAPPPPPAGAALGISSLDRRRIFRQIIRKCVLQLLLIETTHELLQNDDVYQTIPAEHLLRFLGVLDDSYQFARRFNADKDLRMALWKVGFMKQLPNLLKQESSSAATLVNNLLRMYNDPREDHRATRDGVLVKFVPLSLDIIRDFNTLEPETQIRHITAWSPVVVEILQGYAGFDDENFTTHLPSLFPLATDLLLRESGPDVREALRNWLVRVGRVEFGVVAPASST